MTGTGAQADPYIVSNWSDFVTAISTSNAYVEFDGTAENKVIDMKSFPLPNTTGSAVNVSCTSIKFNGWEIRNLQARAANVFYIGVSAITIDDAKFTNVVFNAAATSAAFMKIYYQSSGVKLNNVTITGLLNCNSFSAPKWIAAPNAGPVVNGITVAVQSVNHSNDSQYDQFPFSVSINGGNLYICDTVSCETAASYYSIRPMENVVLSGKIALSDHTANTAVKVAHSMYSNCAICFDFSSQSSHPTLSYTIEAYSNPSAKCIVDKFQTSDPDVVFSTSYANLVPVSNAAVFANDTAAGLIVFDVSGG